MLGHKFSKVELGNAFHSYQNGCAYSSSAPLRYDSILLIVQHWKRRKQIRLSKSAIDAR